MRTLVKIANAFRVSLKDLFEETINTYCPARYFIRKYHPKRPPNQSADSKNRVEGNQRRSKSERARETKKAQRKVVGRNSLTANNADVAAKIQIRHAAKKTGFEYQATLNQGFIKSAARR